jgi:hypothetical protein
MSSPYADVIKSEATNNVVPSPEEIIALAESLGYMERRPTTSFTLFFIEKDPSLSLSLSLPDGMMPPCRINIYYTTRSIMTHLNHPSALDGSTNQLWRSNAYDTLEELREFFLNPRIHTGKGYRNAHKAVRGCVACGEMKTRQEFSNNQWSVKGPDANKCIDCVIESTTSTITSSRTGTLVKPDDTISEIVSDFLISGLENTTLNDPDFDHDPNFPSLQSSGLTLSNLKTHDKINKTNSSSGGHHQQKMERRQFNCPDCPQQGRGAYIFFKKVPAMKPIVKCPKCKRANKRGSKRLYPVPKGSEKGYGLYKCATCADVWGSSRAVSNIGQECHGCKNKRGQAGVMVTPFRLEVYKPKRKGGGGGSSRRVPREPIGEDEVEEREYGDADRVRNSSSESASGAYTAADPSYDVLPRHDEDLSDGTSLGTNTSSMDSSSVGVVGLTRAPSGYKHSCAGCKRGLCKNRKVPVSEVHDVSDGNTVSTRNSIVTNSSVDKSDYIDRDFDFEEFE